MLATFKPVRHAPTFGQEKTPITFSIHPIFKIFNRESKSIQGRSSFRCRSVSMASEELALVRGLAENRQILAELADDAIDWATQHGLVMRVGGNCPEAAVIHAPVSVFPTPFPKELFSKALAVMPTLNLLVDAVSRDEEFLKTTLKSASEYDQFTRQLLDIFNATENERKDRRREVVVGVHRSDYMFDQPSTRLLQVELNTISSSFTGLGSLVSHMHKFTVERSNHSSLDLERIPENAAMSDTADCLAAAHNQMGLKNSVVAMVVQPGEKNKYDQQWISSMVWQKYKVKTVRLSLKEISERGKIDKDGNLRVGDQLVSVVYLRAGYTPVDYPSASEWTARELIEKSTAAKCPSVAYQLTGTKKVQQELAKPGVLERFLNADECATVREFFAGLWSLDDLNDPETSQIVSNAISNPEKFVLKPQREGGGNNLYGKEASEVLAKGEGLAAFILMERIMPPVNKCMLMRNGEWIVEDTMSELGVYGTFVKKGSSVVVNQAAGHLLRTKVSSSDEGGVAAGFAVLDSPYLVD